jgi:hypothetical protein
MADATLLAFGYRLMSMKLEADFEREAAFWVGGFMAVGGGLDILRRLPFLPTRKAESAPTPAAKSKKPSRTRG